VTGREPMLRGTNSEDGAKSEQHSGAKRGCHSQTGRVRMRMELRLRFDYGRVVPWVRRDDGAVVSAAAPPKTSN